MTKPQFNKEEIESAKAMRKHILKGENSELKAVYMAGEICMYAEIMDKINEKVKIKIEDL